MSAAERECHRRDMAALYIAIAEHFEHSAIFLRPNPRTTEETLRLVDIAKARESLGFAPRISLEEGLAATVRWYREVSLR